MNEVTTIGGFSGLLFYTGAWLKAIDKIPNWIIPFVLLAVGAVGYMALNGWTTQNAFSGMYAAAGAVIGDQALKQLTNRNEKTTPSVVPPGVS